MMSALFRLMNAPRPGQSVKQQGGPAFRPQVETLEDRALLSGSPLASDADRSLTTPTPWNTYTNVSADFLSTQIERNLRITDLEVNDDSGTPTFSATLVQNTGDYGKNWRWYYGLSAAQLTTKIIATNDRIVDLDVYTDTNGARRFAAVMVDNSGANAKGWWWYYDISSTDLAAELTQNNARLIDLGSHVVNGTRLFNAVMVENTGEDTKGWWYYYNQTPDEIASDLQDNQARLISIDARNRGHFDIVMVDQDSDREWWYYGLSINQVMAQTQSNGARPFDISPYIVDGQTEYAVLMLDDVNDLTGQVGDILRAANLHGQVGLYLKQVDGPVLADLQGDRQFEPASMIKVLLLLTVMRKVEAGTLNLSDRITIYYQPGDDIDNLTKGNPDVDPTSYPHTASNSFTQTLGKALERMMEISDNRATQAIEQLVGRTAINVTAKRVGMTGTVFASAVGTGVPGNYLTLQDAALLYEKVADGTLLGTGTYLAEFRRRMTDEDTTDLEDVPFAEGVLSSFVTVVQQEAAVKLGLDMDDPAVIDLTNSFVADMKNNWKGGGYDLWFGIDSGHARIDRTAGGYVELPFKTNGVFTPQGFVYGIFIENAVVPRTSTSDAGPALDQVEQAWSDSQGELLRDEIRAALATW